MKDKTRESMMAMPVLKCRACGHEWAPRKSEPPKKCPRCQASYASGAIEAEAKVYRPADPFEAATENERRTLLGILEALRKGKPMEIASIKIMAKDYGKS